VRGAFETAGFVVRFVYGGELRVLGSVVSMVGGVGVLENVSVGDGAARGRYEVEGFIGTQGRTPIFAKSTHGGLADESGEVGLGGFYCARGFGRGVP
jgi:hypothetical protein